MKEILKKVKEQVTIENLLYAFIIISPILDMASFIFRNIFNTSISPSTFIRPIIPICIITYIFFKDKIKLKLIMVSSIYAIYAVVHLIIFNILKTESSYSGIVHELQYLVNYTFMILNLFIYLYTFKKHNTKKLQASVLISITIYIVSIFISIITKTSSSTYIEKMGYKGWFESGNSISAILILSMFILLNIVKEKKYRYWVIAIIILVGIYLTTLIGTRVGLFGFILTLFLYAAVEIFVAILHKAQLNKNILIGSVIAIIAIVVVVGVVGSTTLQRRKHLENIEGNIIDKTNNTMSHISGSLLEIKEKIDKNELADGYMSEESKKSILDLYNFANKHNVVNNDMRTQQLVYNFYLVKNQANPLYMLFGNGYMTNYRELVLEMEIPAFLFNFGVIGFTLYFVPMLLIACYSIYIGFKNRKEVDTEYIMLILGLLFSFALAFLSGYTFFNMSTTTIIIVICTLLMLKSKEIKG
ncbi:MAG: hypothetical protein HFJ58_00770 [Clostridia bacterium]|nr:hypothetical protein [Clostridia bacterium]